MSPSTSQGVRSGSRWLDADLDRADADAGTLSAYSTMVIGVSFKPQIALSRRTAQLLIGWTQRLCKPDLAAFVNRQ